MNSITLTRDGQSVTKIGLSDNPVSAGAQIRRLLDAARSQVRPSDVLVCGGTADFGHTHTLLLPDCIFRSDPANPARWLTHCKSDYTLGEAYVQSKEKPDSWELTPVRSKPSGTSGFSVGRFARFEKFYLGGDCWDPSEDGGLIGFAGEGEAVLEFDGCHVDASQGMDWGIYSWNGKATRTIRVTDTQVDYCALGIAAAASGGNDQTVIVDGCTFNGDANGTKSIGDSRNMGADPEKWGVLAAVLCRKGNVTLVDSHFTARGLSEEYAKAWGCPRIAAICTNHFSGVSGPTSFRLEGCSAVVTPGTAREYFHVDLRGERYKFSQSPPDLLLRA